MIEQFEMVVKAAGDASRIRILKMLEQGELCVCQITAVLDLAPATVSKHLSILKSAGLVLTRREGRWIHYRLADRFLNPHAEGVLALIGDSLVGDGTVERDLARLARVRELPVDDVCATNVALLET